MGDEVAFLAAITAAPDDDLPRLVYADWLDDQGAPSAAGRAALIRRQCGGRPAERALNVGAVDPQVVRAWQAVMPAGAKNYHLLDRGLPDRVFTHALDFISHGEALLGLLPVRSVNLRAADGTAAALAGCRFLGRLTSLYIRGDSFSAADAEALAACPHLTNLTALNLRFSRLTAAAVARILAASPHLHRARVDVRQWTSGATRRPR